MKVMLLFKTTNRFEKVLCFVFFCFLSFCVCVVFLFCFVLFCFLFVVPLISEFITDLSLRQCDEACGL